jgi:molybdopterin-containing oxidoreductase family molybdopterin binding subunit
LVLIEPNDAVKDPYFSTVCLKGISEIEHVYSPTRIQTPMKATGARGSGEFVSISWDEALGIITEKVTALHETYGKESILVIGSSDGGGTSPAALWGAQTPLHSGIDVGIGNGLDPATGIGFGYAVGTNENSDWKNARTLLIVGSNYLESSLVMGGPLFDAKEAGCHIAVVDPHYSTTASKATEWIPIRPGTDAALFLGMASAIIENEWYDQEFMRAHTVFPFLVDVSTGQLVRDHKPVVAKNPADVETPEQNPYKVWDKTTAAPVSHTLEGAAPELEGSYSFEGTTCKTVYQLLRENQEQYTVSWAAEKTGISEEDIVRLAKLYATSKPATLVMGWGGNDKMGNADVVGHAAAVLLGLTGNIGAAGAGIGVYAEDFTIFAMMTALASWPLPDECAPSPGERASWEYRTEQSSVRALVMCGDSHQQMFANMKVTAEWLKTLDFVLYIDVFHSTGADYADVILPACTRLECDEEIGGITLCRNHVRLRQKVLEPLFDSKPDDKILFELAKVVGAERHLPASTEEKVRFIIENSTDPAFKGLSLEALQSNQGVFKVNGADAPRSLPMEMLFFTPSTKLELYYEGLLDDGQELPNYEDAQEAYAGNPLAEKYPLQFHNGRTKYYIHNQFCNAAWIQQYREPVVELNPQELVARGLIAGEHVEVFNDRSALGCRIMANEAIRPGSARYYEGTWTRYAKKGNVQELTNDVVNPRGAKLMVGPVIPFNDTLVEVRKASATEGGVS